MSVAGKRAIVTGSSRGIGASIARTLAAAGARVVVNCETEIGEGQAVADEINVVAGEERAFAVKANVGDPSEAETLIGTGIERLGGLDILVNNAGIESTVAAIDLDVAEWDRIFGVNLRGAFVCARTAARHMRATGGGVIINVSSIHQDICRLGATHYAVSKAGLKMLTKSLALEWAEFGIRVVGVAPGAIETERNRSEIAAFGRERFEKWIPASRLGAVEDVARTVAFFASNDAAYITGTTLEIDGGYGLNVIRYDPRKG